MFLAVTLFVNFRIVKDCVSCKKYTKELPRINLSFNKGEENGEIIEIISEAMASLFVGL